MKYKKPKIKSRELKASFLFSRRNFFDHTDFLAGFIDGQPPDPGQCFLPGTNILLANGRIQEIEKIRAGELVLSYDLKKQEIVKERVEKLLIHDDNTNSCFIINNFLKITANHPVWINGLAWKRVDELCRNDVLLNSDGGKVVVESIKKIKKVSIVYNLHLHGNHHNYFADNILVHNKSVCSGC
ncbi:hypothetical protein HY041_00795 [Candidatus Roizmanbacteria bacterium]|nr:hypothetical protein [Candidatus Roizmanbacteria bacterium]